MQGTLFSKPILAKPKKGGFSWTKSINVQTPKFAMSGKNMIIHCYLRFLQIATKDNPHLEWVKKRLNELGYKGDPKCLTKPDMDNIIKSVFDALNDVIWHDDSQVVNLACIKRYSATPRIEVEIDY